jgi:TatA/E family protein of Tat protein translocase
MFTLGVPEMVIIFILALVLFGPRKLPELGRTIGKAMTEFRRASNDLKATFEREMHAIEQENRALQATTRETARELADHASYGLAPAETIWNPLQQALDETLNPEPAATAQAGTPPETAHASASEAPPAVSSTGQEVVARAATPAPEAGAPSHS